MQVMLDRGEELDWFGSVEIVMEAIIASSAFYLFIVHIVCPRREPLGLFRPCSETALHRMRILILVVGPTYYASLALQPPYLQNLMDYPIVKRASSWAPAASAPWAR